MQLILASALVLLSPVAPATESPGPSDKARVRGAIQNYITAVYDRKPELIDKSVHPELAKLGLSRRDGKPARDIPMSFARLRELCTEEYDYGSDQQDIEVLGVLDRVACGKLTAAWGTDYFQLGRDEAGGPWKIRHVIWQSKPGIRGDAVAEEDLKAIETAAYDYIDGFYRVEPGRMDRAVAKDLVKFGYYAPPGSKESFAMPMNFDELKELAANVFRGVELPKDAPRVVEILDALDHIALVKVVGAWGIDYMHVAKREGAWKILHVIWQSHPAETNAAKRESSDGESSGDESSVEKAVDGDAAGESGHGESGNQGEALRVADAVNGACPFSGGAIQADSLASYDGKVVGFCNPDCRDKFASNPALYVKLIPELDA